MFRIHTLNKISPVGLAHFDGNRYALDASLDDADAVILRSADMHELDFAQLANLKSVARAGAGVNNIPIPRCSEKGIVVFNTPGANANAVAELVILGILASARPIIKAAAWAQTLIGEGDEVPKRVEKGKSQFVGPEIKGKTIGIIGLGAIGSIVAHNAHALGMNIVGYDPYKRDAAAANLPENSDFVQDLNELYARCDYITLHIPQTPETKNTINADAIAHMKAGVRVMNFSRGGLVDSAAMIEALNSGKVAAYVTDFCDEALLKTENAICLPHLGASTPEAEDNCASMAVQQTMDYLENGNIINSVNFPRCTLERGNAAQRLSIIALNAADFEAQVAKALPHISASVIQTRNEISYAIVELSNAVDIDKISGIDGLVSVRAV